MPHRLPYDLSTAKYDELQERLNYDDGCFSEVTEYSIVGLSGLVNLLHLVFFISRPIFAALRISVRFCRPERAKGERRFSKYLHKN